MSHLTRIRAVATLSICAAISCAAPLAAQQKMAPPGGVYSDCNGIPWSSSPATPTSMGKVCVHCRDGSEVRLYMAYELDGQGRYTGQQNYFGLDERYICTDTSTRCAIFGVCR